MRLIRLIAARLAGLFRGHERGDADLRAEMEAHLAMETDEFIRRGMRPDEARRQALLASGGLTQAAEQVREQRGLPWIENLVADARYAVRHFRRTPLATLTMVLVLSLGIGVNVVLFTVMTSLSSMPPAGITRDDALVRLRGSLHLARVGAFSTRLLSWPEVQEYAAHTELFSSVAAYAGEFGLVDAGQEPAAPVSAGLVYITSNYSSMLGVQPALGAWPSPEPDVMRLATSPTVMISHTMWQEQFGGAREVLGRTVRINGISVEVVGVAPPRFTGTAGNGPMTVWLPLAAYPLLQRRAATSFATVDSMFLSAIARLRPDVAAEDAAPVVAGIASRVFRPSSDTTGETGSAVVLPLRAGNHRIGDRSDELVSTAAAVGFALLALLITCTNVSALMVGLAVARRREIGVRLSLGAPRRRLIRQLLTESVLLALSAAVVGLVVTAATIRVLDVTLENVQLTVDWRVTAATCAIAILTGVLFGLSPALHATRVSLSEVLKSSATSVAAVRSRLQRGLVVAQVALTQPLLVGLGVVVATMISDLGSRATSRVPDRIAEIGLDTWAGRVSNEERAAHIDGLVRRIAALPGVVAAMPMQMGVMIAPVTVHPEDRIAGRTYAPRMEASLTAAPGGYFGAFDIPIVRGRDFEPAEYAHAPLDPSQPVSYRVAIIGSDLARRLWGDADPVGRRLDMAFAAGSEMVVVGVVDEAAAGPSEVNEQVRVWVPYSSMNTGVIARTEGPALPLLNAMRRAAQEEAPQMPITRAQTVEQRDEEFRRNLLRTSGSVAGGGLLALLLSAIGLYAVVSLAVGQRTREIGIRTALGARRGQVTAMFFAKGLALSGLGLVLGLPLSMILTRQIAAWLNWPLTTSPLLGVAIGAVVLVVASIAAWIPARRASTIDPLVALRTE